MRVSSQYLYGALIVAHSFSSVLAGFEDQLPPPPQPNDITGTVNGCANAILEHDIDQDGAIRRNEYLSFVNNVADLLCIPPRPNLDLELQTVFVSIACLCQELEGNDITCCFGESAGLYDQGAANVVGRTQNEESYLRAACLLTQAVLGPEQCELPVATLAPGAVATPIVVPPFVAPVAAEPSGNPLLWLLLLLLLLLCCICCCCYRRDKETEEEYEVTVKEEVIVQGPDDPIADKSIPPVPVEPPMEPPIEPDVEQAMSVPPSDPAPADPPIPPMPLPPIVPEPEPKEPEPEPFSAGDEFDEDGDAPRPGPDMPVPPVAAGAPGMGEDEDDEEDEENIGRKLGANPDDDEEEDGGRRFGGQGMLPNPPAPEGVVLRHIEKEAPPEVEYEYPERNINEFKYKREDSGQILDHYVADGGVYDPKRPPKAPVVFNPSWERTYEPEPVYIDPRKQRKQMGLGDGEVWDALNNWEEEEAVKGHVEQIDWVISSALTAFAGAEETGELEQEGSSEEEATDDEED